MPIDATCPHCRTGYRLKDELAGKSVTCRTATCRKIFVVVAVPRPKAEVPPVAIDTDDFAAKLFAEEEAGQKVVIQEIDVSCEVCFHPWKEPATKIGKVVLCPECKHRQRIPEPKQKVADWRDASGGRRLLEKGPELPKDLAEQTMQEASLDALLKAGAIEAPALEPRPLSDYLFFIGVPALLLLGIGFGLFWFISSRGASGEAAFMATAVDEIEAIKNDGPLPKGQPPLFRAALHLANAEYQLGLNTAEGTKAALKAIVDVRKELDGAVPSAERDAIYAELALLLPKFSGSDEQVNEEIRLRWSQSSGKAPPVGLTKTDDVQTKLKQVLSTMRDHGVSSDIRFWTLRKLASELGEAGQAEMLLEIFNQGIRDEELLEAQSQILFAFSRSGTPTDKLMASAEDLKSQLAGPAAATQRKPTAPAAFHVLGIKDAKVPIEVLPGGTGPVRSEPRLANALFQLAQGQNDAAKVLALRADNAGDKYEGLAMLAENAGEGIFEAASAVGGDLDQRKRAQWSLYRLARAAAEAGAFEPAQKFAELIADEGLRELGLAFVLRAKWTKEKAAPSAGDLSKPDDANSIRIGQAMRALFYARQRAAILRDANATAEYDGWKAGELRGFGYAGLALGLQNGR